MRFKELLETPVELLSELFNNPTATFEWLVLDSDQAIALFEVAGIKYEWMAELDGPENWVIQFKLLDGTTFGNVGLSKTGNAAEVLSTVVAITKEFIQRYKKRIVRLEFSAKEVSRQDLYMKMVSRLLPEWQVQRSESGMTFVVWIPISGEF